MSVEKESAVYKYGALREYEDRQYHSLEGKALDQVMGLSENLMDHSGVVRTFKDGKKPLNRPSNKNQQPRLPRRKNSK